MSEPTVHELARDIEQVDRARREDRAQIEARMERERREVLDEIRSGFVAVNTSIASLSFVRQDVWESERDRIVGSVKHLREEVTQARRQFVGGLLIVLVLTVVTNVLTG